MTIESWTKLATKFDCPCCTQFVEFKLAKPKGNVFKTMFPGLLVLETSMMIVCQDCNEETPSGEALMSGAPLESIALGEAGKHLLAEMAVADGEIGDKERALIDQVLRKLGIDEERIEDLYAQSADPDAQGMDLLATMAEYLPFLSLRSRCTLLEAAYHLAQVDGHFADDEITLLQSIAKALKIPVGEFDILLDLAEQKQNFFDGFVAYFRELEGSPACLPDGAILPR